MYKGKALNLQIIGESHSESIGMILCGVPKGENINLQELQNFVDRRKSNSSKYSTKRKEKDKIILQSGIQNNATETGRTNGDDIKFCIKNECQNSTDYNNIKNIPRPSHADYPAYIKYNGQSLVGGGKFSGRMTAPICIAGGIAKQILAQKNIFVGAYVSEIGNILSCSYKQKKITYDDIKKAQQNSLHLINSKSALDILNKIEVAQKEGDSLGGVVEAIAFNVPVGLGDNLFDGLESYISNAIFAIPAVKGVEFGIGFDITKLCGSSANDCYTLKNDCKKSATVCKIGATVKTSATDSEMSVTGSKMSVMHGETSVMHGETSVMHGETSVMHGETSAVNATNVKDITSKITCTSNNNGGIVGGMSNGMPLCVRVAIKPTPSIFKQQDSVDLQTLQNVKLNIEGRHDTCIVPRAVVCVEAMLCLVILDFLIDDKNKNSIGNNLNCDDVKNNGIANENIADIGENSENIGNKSKINENINKLDKNCENIDNLGENKIIKTNEGNLSKIELQRKKIDEIDEKMTQLYVERMQCAKQIGLEKAKTDESVFVSARENEILNKVACSVPEDLVEQTKQFYNTIFETSKNYQSTSIKNLNKKD